MPDNPIAQLATDLSQARSPDEFHTANRRALESFDRLNSQYLTATGVKLACGEGCLLCCWLRVDVCAHEVFAVADHIRAHFTAEELLELLTQLVEHEEKVLPLTPFEHATQNVVCPLLVNGRCSVDAVRPQSCRRHHSTDLVACQYTYDHPTDLDIPGAHVRALFRGLSEAMMQGIEVYAQLGFDYTIYELGTALAEALNDPTSWLRWQNRGPAFLRAAATPTE